MSDIKVRGKKPAWPYEVSKVPRKHIVAFSEHITMAAYLGIEDEGQRWTTEWPYMFAKSVGGKHIGGSVGHIDVVKGNLAWSLKTIKTVRKNVYEMPRIRIISGRNSPDFSRGIANPRRNITKTGETVIKIWNKRVHDSFQHCPLGPRIAILVRNVPAGHFMYFEIESKKYNPAEYTWKKTQNDTIGGYEKKTDKHMFTWQPTGSQFSIYHDVPEHATIFSIKKLDGVYRESLKKTIGFDKSWITISNRQRMLKKLHRDHGLRDK